MAARRILILSTGIENTGEVNALAGSLAAQGASVLMRRCGDDYDAVLDDIAQADTVVFWR
jgi:sialic acid synthase SpsE